MVANHRAILAAAAAVVTMVVTAMITAMCRAARFGGGDNGGGVIVAGSTATGVLPGAGSGTTSGLVRVLTTGAQVAVGVISAAVIIGDLTRPAPPGENCGASGTDACGDSDSGTSEPTADPAATPELPGNIIGNNGKTGGRRINTDLPGGSGGLFDQYGGTTGIVTLPDGTKVSPNGVRLRPGSGSGPRLDIPANGSKPHETIHFPPGG